MSTDIVIWGLIMKKQKKWALWTGLISSVVIALVALLAAFVPIKTKNGTYKSFFGAQSYSADLVEKMVITYTYDADSATIENAKDACKTIQNYLTGKGYVSASATPVGTNQIQVTLAKPSDGKALEDAMTLLGSYGVGVGSFEIKTSTSSTAESIIVGSKHVKKVSTTTSSGYYYTVVTFTDQGKALIQAAEAAAAEEGKSNSYYLFFGGSTSITGAQPFTYSQNFVNGDLYIGGFASEATAEQYQLLCEMGSLKVALNQADASDIMFENMVNVQSGLNVAQIILWSFCLAVSVAYLVIIALRHGAYAYIAAFIVNAIAISLALLLFVAMDFVELYASSIIAIAICVAVFNQLILSMFEKMRAQNNLGKDFDMSADSGYMQSLKLTIITGVSMLIIGLVSAVIFSGAIQAASTIIAVFGALSLLFILLITKWLFVALVKLFPVSKATLVWGGEKNEK